MNYWSELSVAYATQRNYLDDLFTVYPTIPDGIRDIDQTVWGKIETAFNERNDDKLLRLLLNLHLFPIKDSYVAYLKRDSSAIDRNPATVARLCGRLRELGLNKIYEKCSEPKETNRQIGPFFRRWLNKGTLGAPLVKSSDFMKNKNNAILDAGDNEMKLFAKEHFNYTRDKGLDFVARFNHRYILGEAKFLTDFGGHQNAQFADGIYTAKSEVEGAKVIAIYDGVCYIKGKSKLYRFIDSITDFEVMSALVLREYLYQL
ncbi:MAG: restriction endonuclease [Ignavibacteria bacterium]